MSANTTHPSDQIVAELINLLRDFRSELHQDDLRKKVKALVPVHKKLTSLDRSLIPSTIASSARRRLLHYFKSYPFCPIPREELMIVAAIDQWARRVRELRVERGWSIVSGIAAKEMDREGEFPVEGINVQTMRPDDYILVNPEQDLEAAYRWNIAKEIRGSNLSVRDKILAYLKENVSKPITGEELRYVAKDSTEWARRVRELRNEFGWPIVTKNSGRPDLPVGIYLLESLRQSPEHDRHIADAVRRQVLRRDNYACRRCSWNHALWNRSDPRHLEHHHIRAHIDGGQNVAENLITLCTVCHDQWHAHDGRNSDVDFMTWLASH